MIRRWVRGPRAVVATLASSDLLFNTLSRLDPTTLRSSLELAAGSTALSVVLTELSRHGATFGALAVAFQYALVGFFIYEFAPRIYPDGFGPVTDERPFRLVTVAVTFVFMLNLEEALPVPALPLFGLATLVFGGYLLARSEQSLYRQLDTESGPFFDVLSTLLPTEDGDGSEDASDGADTSDSDDASDGDEGTAVDRDTSVKDTVGAGGLRGRVAGGFVVAVVGAVFAVVCAMFGMLSVAVGTFYPLLELSALGYVAYGHVEGRVSRAPSPDAAIPELEDAFYESVAPAFRQVPIKGMATVLAVALGLVAAGKGFGFVGGAVVSGAARETLATLLAPPVNVPGVLLFVGALAYSVFALWFWFAVTQRVPAFFDYYRTRRETDELTEPRDPAATRPPGAMVAPTLLVVVPVALAGVAPGPVGTGVGVAVWVAALGATGWAAWRARTAPPQPPRTERVALPVAFAVQVPVPLYLNEAAPTLAAPATGAAAFLATNGYVAAAMATMGVLFFFVEDAMWYMRRGRPVLEYLPAAMGAAVALLAVPLLDGAAGLLVAGGIVALTVGWAGLIYRSDRSGAE